MTNELKEQTTETIIREGAASILEAMEELFDGLAKVGTARMMVRIKVQTNGGLCLVKTESDAGGVYTRGKTKREPVTVNPNQPEML